ncbi:TPA: hypothetical protein N0F65_003639 [Lagenidium giganteum]|uniref:Uncharacterized protein n=1 Tax=Lagenidium giganteum TaxID=4803 RepID=A0AAV2YMI6_9STRA|nr:TPA: hypothetical protein N0F65_003639 [Lagenidium giganteum]
MLLDWFKMDDTAAWIAKFALLDASYCFLSKHRALLSIKTVLALANSLGSHKLTEEDLRVMAQLAPGLMTVGPRPGADADRDDGFHEALRPQGCIDVVTFPGLPNVSKKASTQRKKHFAEAIKQKRPPGATSAAAVTTLQNPDVSPCSTAGPKPTSTSATKPTPIRMEPPHPCAMVEELRKLDIDGSRLVHIERRAPRAAEYVDMRSLSAPPAVEETLARRGVTQLYSHQFQAIQAAMTGKNVVLSTSTASGKSLAFYVPMLWSLLESPNATFFYLFPTKALAQDQLKSLQGFLMAAELSPALCATFDGDTPMKTRRSVIKETQIFLTNPDMLHLTILPNHPQWKQVLSHLRYVVVDEAHMYRGVFGSHVACVFRRLFRLCAMYGSNPQVICCSATIRNPEEHFRLLIPRLPPLMMRSNVDFPSPSQPPHFDFFYDRDVEVITKDGAPTGEKYFCVWNPKNVASESIEHVDERSTNSDDHQTVAAIPKQIAKKPQRATRKRKRAPAVNPDDDTEQEEKTKTTTSAIYQSAQMFSKFVQNDAHTLLFCKGRKLAELVLMTVHSIFQESVETQLLTSKVQCYRGGYTAQDRRGIERRLFHGDLTGVIATNALELGIDVGDLDCTMHLGLPTSVASLWQQAGRAGRKHDQLSLAVIVCFDSPLDQHFARHTDTLFTLEAEAATLNPFNRKVLRQQLLCAARETPLLSKRFGMDYIDQFLFSPPPTQPVRDVGASHGDLVREMLASEPSFWPCAESDGGGFRVRAQVAAAITRSTSLRSISDTNYQVVTDDDIQVQLDEISGERVFFQVYPSAVYLHQAQEYIITKVDNDRRMAFARRCRTKLNCFTSCRDFTEVEPVRVFTESRHRLETMVYTGIASVLTTVYGATVIEKKTMRVLNSTEFSLPPMQHFGHAVWLDIPHDIKQQVEAQGYDWNGALHGAGHLVVAVVPLFVLCDSGDINTSHFNEFEQRVRPSRLTVYEGREGGSGLVDEIVKHLAAVVRKAQQIASECPCVSGCPSCIHSAECSEYNKVLNKHGSLIVLTYLASAIDERPVQ